MKARRTSCGTSALVALALFGTACASSDDVAEVRDVAASAVDQPANSGTENSDAMTEAPVPTDTGPATTDGATSDGFVFTAPTEDYVITFPGEPSLSPLAVPLPTGQATAEAFIYEDGGDAAYFTSVFDYPDGAIDSDPELVLIDARDGAIANVGGTLLDSEFVDRDGVPGVAFSFEVVDGSTAGGGNALLFVDGLRLYQSFALGFSGQTDQFQAFLDTFMFTADQAGDS